MTQTPILIYVLPSLWQLIVGQQLKAKAAKQEAEIRRAQIAKVRVGSVQRVDIFTVEMASDQTHAFGLQVEKERLAAQKERELKAQEEQMNILNTSFNRFRPFVFFNKFLATDNLFLWCVCLWEPLLVWKRKFEPNVRNLINLRSDI